MTGLLKSGPLPRVGRFAALANCHGETGIQERKEQCNDAISCFRAGGEDERRRQRGRPFLTIGQAAAIARAGDEVVVHAGTYRESVDPRFGGESATNRIVYRAAAGEPRPVITGSERIDTWQPEGDGVWKP